MDLLLDDHHLNTDAVSLKKNIQNQIKRNIEAITPNDHDHMSVKSNLILSYLHLYNSTLHILATLEKSDVAGFLLCRSG